MESDFKELDISDWGAWELDQAATLIQHLTAGRISYAARSRVDMDSIKIHFNMKIPRVYLADSEYVTLVAGNMDGNAMLVLYLFCPDCGHEGRQDDLEEFERYKTPDCPGCLALLGEMKEVAA